MLQPIRGDKVSQIKSNQNQTLVFDERRKPEYMYLEKNLPKVKKKTKKIKPYTMEGA